MTTYKLYHMPGACSRVTLVALEEAQVAYEDQAVDLFSGAQRSPAYLEINPKGKVPTLVHDGRLLTENVGILLFLHGRHPSAGLLPVGRDDLESTAFVADLIWCSNTLHPLARTIRMPARTSPGDPEGTRALACDQLSAIASSIEERLANGWWHGATWSIVDVYLAWCLDLAAGGGWDRAAFPRIQAHADRVREHPSFKRALARETAALARQGIALPPGFAL